MWQTPRMAMVVCGTGEGTTALTAFDRALLDAGIGHLNIARVSSVLPPGCRVVRQGQNGNGLDIAPGSLVPVVYGYLTSGVVGSVVSSAIAVGVPTSEAQSGMIFEASVLGDVSVARELAERMVREAMETRGTDIREVILGTAQLEVRCKVGCSLTAVVMLP